MINAIAASLATATAELLANAATALFTKVNVTAVLCQALTTVFLT